MTHKEFRLKVNKEIIETSATYTSAKVILYKVGDILNVDENTFEVLKSGNTVERYTQEGMVKFDKYNFENEVECIKIETSFSTVKLGQRKT